VGRSTTLRKVFDQFGYILLQICQKPDRFSAEFIERHSILMWVNKTLTPRVGGGLAASHRHHIRDIRFDDTDKNERSIKSHLIENMALRSSQRRQRN
jgi:hypothetical protein